MNAQNNYPSSKDLIACKVKHDILGQISIILGDVDAGTLLLHTFYIYYYQSHMSDCQSYIRERNVYSDNPERIEYIKEHVYTFHDYTGVLVCLKYQ